MTEFQAVFNVLPAAALLPVSILTEFLTWFYRGFLKIGKNTLSTLQ